MELIDSVNSAVLVLSIQQLTTGQTLRYGIAIEVDLRVYPDPIEAILKCLSAAEVNLTIPVPPKSLGRHSRVKVLEAAFIMIPSMGQNRIIDRGNFVLRVAGKVPELTGVHTQEPHDEGSGDICLIIKSRYCA